jgi:pimeloyl-ACP methyl ester carboxylesterase
VVIAVPARGQGTNDPTLDFGDAPDAPYPSLLANNGARHLVQVGLRLGNLVDAEADALHNSTATGDAGDDGVNFTFVVPGFPFNSTYSYISIVPGRQSTLRITASAAGRLDAWMDFNGNGSWADANEQIFNNQALSAGANNLTFQVPANAKPAFRTFARFRFSSAGGLGVTGQAEDGEVEDYAVRISRGLSIGGEDYTFNPLPPKQHTKAVVLIHGNQSNPTAWANQMGADIDAVTGQTWDILPYDWSQEAARNNSIPGNAGFARAVVHGQYLGAELAIRGYEHIHFLGHSLGGRVLQTANSTLRLAEFFQLTPPAVIHATFLDAYTPNGERGFYGSLANCADSYFNRSDYPSTEGGFTAAYSADATPVGPCPLADCLAQGLGMAGQGHAWPYNWYRQTIPNPQWNHPGFGFSKEAAIITKLNWPPPRKVAGKGAVEVIPIFFDAIPPREPRYLASLQPQVSPQSSVGIVNYANGTTTLTATDSDTPASIVFELDSTAHCTPIQYLKFDYHFSGTSNALFSVSAWDQTSNTWVSVYDLVGEFLGTNELAYRSEEVFIEALPPGTNALRFTLVSTDAHSASAQFSNLIFGATIEATFSLVRSGSNLFLSWPADMPGAAVQETASLTPPIVWVNITDSPQIVNCEMRLTFSAPVGTRFFRLCLPDPAPPDQ